MTNAKQCCTLRGALRRPSEMTWHEVQEVAVIAKQLLVLSPDPAILSYAIFEVGTKACSMFLIIVLKVSPSSTTSQFAD